MSVQSDFEEFASYLNEAKRQRDHWKARALSAERKIAEIGKLDQWNPKYIEQLSDPPSGEDKIIWVVRVDKLKEILGGQI